VIKRYESTAALRAAYLQGGDKRCAWGSSDSWYGNESHAQTLHYSEVGDTKLVPTAEALLDKLDTQIETSRRMWERAPAGAFTCVPDMLAGLPTPMRRQMLTTDDRAPITILATTTSSAGISASTLAKRGTVILALVMALSRIRPVSLHQLTVLDGKDTGETVLTSEINTSPLDLATACYVLTSAGFARRLTYGLATKLNQFDGGWPRGYRFGNSKPYFADLVLRLGLDPKLTLVIASAELHDMLLSQPVAWINAQIANFTNQEEDPN
jgi:hypothetical protein